MPIHGIIENTLMCSGGVEKMLLTISTIYSLIPFNATTLIVSYKVSTRSVSAGVWMALINLWKH